MFKNAWTYPLTRRSTEDLDAILDSLQEIDVSLQSAQALQASALVGRTLCLVSERFRCVSVHDLKILVEVPEDIAALQLALYSGSDDLISSIDIFQPESRFLECSFAQFNLDESNFSKTHSLRATAWYQNNKMSLKTMLLANINGVSFSNNGEGLKLNLAGMGLVSLVKIRQMQAS